MMVAGIRQAGGEDRSDGMHVAGGGVRSEGVHLDHGILVISC